MVPAFSMMPPSGVYWVRARFRWRLTTLDGASDPHAVLLAQHLEDLARSCPSSLPEMT